VTDRTPTFGWRELEPLLDAALDGQPADRAALIARAKLLDPALGAEFEALLRDARPGTAAPMLDREAGELFASLLRDDADIVAALFAEALTGRYTVSRKIGAGGMATVYLAHDVRHDREVAIKLLHPDLAAAIGAERFLAEIRTTARLQHPHILPLLDSGEAGGQFFYVMPFVEGESLRDQLDREKLLPIDVAIRHAREIASALDYAHRQGVVHRDIKPENVLLHDGQALVADFGIALAVSNAAGARITQTGRSLGTPQYMSPEQASGDGMVDARADIFSLGAVTYEMLTGEPPHAGANAQAVIARVLGEKPRDIRSVRPNVPIHVAGAIERALEKLAADRWTTAKEFGEALTNERFAWAGAGQRVSPPGNGGALTPFWRTAVARAVAIGAACLALGAVLHARLAPQPAQRSSRFVLTMPDSAGVEGVVGGGRLALTRDGALIAYVGTTPGGGHGIYTRALSDPVPQRVAGTDGGQAPMFSPDGRSLAFVSNRKLLRVPIEGGVPTLLADSAATGVWGDGNQIVFARSGKLYRVSGDGGPVTLLAAPDTASGQFQLTPTSILPGGKTALVVIGSRAGSQLGVLRLAGGQISELGMLGGSAKYDGHGHVLFGRADGTLAAVPFSLRSLAATGPAVTIVKSLQVMTGNGRTDFAVADDGTLVFVTGTSGARQMVSVDRRGAARTLTAEPRLYGWPRVSPDGQKVAVEIQEPGQPRWDVWVYNLPARTLSRLTTNNDGAGVVGWTRDGKRVIYSASDSARPEYHNQVRYRLWDGSGPAEELLRRDRALADASVDPLLNFMVIQAFDDERTRTDLFLVTLRPTPTTRPLVSTPAIEIQPRLSPDGRWLAYVSDESGTNEVYIRRVPEGEGRLQVSSGGGSEPVWAASGRELFYRTPQHLIAASLRPGAGMALTARDTLFEDRYSRGAIAYGAFPGGREFLMLRNIAAISQIGVVINWRALLDKP